MPAPGDGGQARLLATGSIVQQGAQVAGLLGLLAIITVLARRLSLEELGVYGLLSSLAGYLLVIQNSAASAAVRSMAAATTQDDRDRTFSTAVLLYAAAGALTGLLIAAIGVGLAAAVDLRPDLRSSAQLGAIGLGLVTAVGWPITVYRDAMRARQLFVRAAGIDTLGMVAFTALVLGLTYAGAGLAVLIAASGTIPLFSGVGALIASRVAGLPFAFRPGAATRAEASEFARLAGYVSATEAAGVLVYALDRAVLGLFVSAATIGLYEGPVRAHNVVRALNAALTVTVLPSASRYVGAGDTGRLSALMLRGTRYTLALIVPMTVTGMVLAPDVLQVWLGPGFREGGLTMAILMSYWLVNGSTGVLAGIIVAGGAARSLARLAWPVALGNLAMSLALTPWLGLEGVAIGTAIPYFIAFPITLGFARAIAPVGVRELVVHGYLPAYAVGAGLAVLLIAARTVLDLDSVIAVVAVAGGGTVAAWLAIYALFMEPHERRLVRAVAGSALPGRSRAQQ